eukprot:jgi/Bigna1/69564/fgenesh1_pg.9_\
MSSTSAKNTSGATGDVVGSGNKSNAANTDQKDAGINMPRIVLSVENPLGKAVLIDATPTDCLMDIRQYLLETPESCYFTCYQLVHEGKVINDYAELSEYPELKEDKANTIKMVPGFYDEPAARVHVRRLREIIVNPPVHITQKQHPYVSDEASTSGGRSQGNKGGKKSSNSNSNGAAGRKKDKETPIGEIDLTQFSKEERKEKVPEVVRNITFSAWNPPPGNRRLRDANRTIRVVLTPVQVKDSYGDYQKLPALWDSGRMPKSLISLSTGRWLRLLEQVTKKERKYAQAYGMLFHEERRYDWNRAEDSLLTTYGMEGGRGVLRDWNEEYQCCHEMPRDTLVDRILYNRTKYRVYLDFRDAAVKGACAVINGNIPPINPTDEERAWVYLYNKIFFSLTIDGRDNYKDIGGDRVSHCNASHDILGITEFERADIKELYTLATLSVDYRGHRVLAQSIIPGIFHGDQASSHVYGCMDSTDTIKFDTNFHGLMQKAAEKLHIKEHTLIDKDGSNVTLASAIETKGIIGSDRRHYVLDLTRVFPRDANFPDYKQHPTALLRPELIMQYCWQKVREQLERAKQEAIKRKKEEQQKPKKEPAAGDKNQKAAKDDGDEKKKGESVKEAAAAAAATAAAGGDDKKEETEREKKKGDKASSSSSSSSSSSNPLEAQLNNIKLANIRLNTDVFCDLKFADEKQMRKDEDDVVEAAGFLLRRVVPHFAAQCNKLQQSPLDGAHLVRLMHKSGINVRYLGQMAALAVKLNMPHIAQLCTSEMIVRAAKHLLNGMLRGVKPELGEKQESWFLGPCIARFLNSFLGAHCCGIGLSEDQLASAGKVLDRLEKEHGGKDIMASRYFKKTLPRGRKGKHGGSRKKNSNNGEAPIKLANGKRAPTDPLSPANLWVSILRLVQKKYNCKLPPFQKAVSSRRKLCMLRGLCKKVGIQLACRNYRFSSSAAAPSFKVEDVLDLVPVVKTIELESKDAAECLKQAKMFLSINHLHHAYAKLSDAQNILHQTYGPMHSQTGHCYALLALVCYRAQDIPQAVEMQQKALLVFERTLGLDHSETAYAHSTMALFLHSMGQPQVALRHIKRSLFLLELICGPYHPDVAAAHINIAMIYQDSKQVGRGLKHLRRAKEVFTTVFGDKHFQIGLCDHTIAVAHSLMGNFREAIKFEKSAKSIYSDNGRYEKQAQESKLWLSWFTKQAVEVEKGLSKKGGLIPVHPNLSPFVWVSLQKIVPSRIVSPAETIQLYRRSVAMRQQQQQQQQNAAAAAAAAISSSTRVNGGGGSSTGGGGGGGNQTSTAQTEPLSKSQKRKLKRKLQKQRQKAEKEAAAKRSQQQQQQQQQ